MLATLAGIYASWLAFMATHEAGHVLHAWLVGGTVDRVVLPLWGFSRTDVTGGASRTFIVAGGPVWGVLLPVMLCGVVRGIRKSLPAWLRFFCGFCLIANGAYIGVGWLEPTGDAGELRALGVPIALMVTLGAASVAGGLWMWHRVPNPFRRRHDTGALS
ncbi:MAG TPA: hypothetical protein VGN72_09130 [Tepidisphaeraceae bacterium]|jgi:hypothetical protein|nr:hypothetical protein [Tepidisphaeraceae bacterium]